MAQDIEKSAMAKIYIRLLPFAILSYFLAYVDRINVSFAALTMRDDLKMSASAYGFALRRRRFFGQWDKLRADRSKEV